MGPVSPMPTVNCTAAEEPRAETKIGVRTSKEKGVRGLGQH